MEIAIGGGSGVSGTRDHGALLGLQDDDHYSVYPNETGRAGGQEIYGGLEPYEALFLGGTNQADLDKKGVVVLDDNTPLRLGRVDEALVPPASGGPGALADLEGGLIYVRYQDPDPTAVQGGLYYSDGSRWVLVEGVVMDSIPPADPTGLDLNTGTYPDGRSWVDMSWEPNTEEDLSGYLVFRKGEAADPWSSIAYVFGTGTPHYLDFDVVTEEDYWYGLAAFDRYGNVSGISIPDQVFINAGDKTRPLDVTNVVGWSLDNTAVITWEDPTGTPDLWRIELWYNDTADANILPRWGSSILVGTVDPGVEHFEFVRTDLDDGEIDTDRFYVAAVDTAKNKSHPKPSTALLGYPPYADVTFNNTVWSRGTKVTPSTAPNSNGWWNAAFNVTIEPILTIEDLALVDPPTPVAYYYVDESGTPVYFGAGPTFSISTETLAAGRTYSFFIYMSDGSFTNPANFTAYLDTTPPAVVEGFAINQRSMQWVSLVWTARTGDVSGIWGYNIYRTNTVPVYGEDPVNATKIASMVKGTYYADMTLPEIGNTYYFITAVDLAGNEGDYNPGAVTAVGTGSEFRVNIDVVDPPNENGWWKDPIHLHLSLLNDAGFDAVVDSIDFSTRLLVAGGTYSGWNGTSFTDYSGGGSTVMQSVYPNEDMSPYYEVILTESGSTTKGNTIEVRLRATLNVDQGDPLNADYVVSAKASMLRFKIDTVAPLPPTSLVVTPAEGFVVVSWNNGSDALSGLWKTKIYRCDTIGGTYVEKGEVLSSNLKWNDTTAVAGTTYYYKASHLDKAGNESILSDVGDGSGNVPIGGSTGLTLSVQRNKYEWHRAHCNVIINHVPKIEETVAEYLWQRVVPGAAINPIGWISSVTPTISTDIVDGGGNYLFVDADGNTPVTGYEFWAKVLYASGRETLPAYETIRIDVGGYRAGYHHPEKVSNATATWTGAGALIEWDQADPVSPLSGYQRTVITRSAGGAPDTEIFSIDATTTLAPTSAYLDTSAPENTLCYYNIINIDKADNNASTTCQVTTGQKGQDTIKITGTPVKNANGWNNGTVTLLFTLVPVSNPVSHAATWHWKFDGATSWTNSTGSHPDSYSTTLGTSGRHTVEARATLDNGTLTPVATYEFWIDLAAPNNPTAETATKTQLDSATAVKLAWTNGTDAVLADGTSGSGLQFTNIYRRTNNASYDPTTKIAQISSVGLDGAAQTYVDADTDTSTRYHYWIGHTDNAGNVSTPSYQGYIDTEHSQLRAQRNYLDNSSFERGETFSGTAPAAWMISGSCTWQSGTPFHGTKYMQLSGSLGEGSYISQDGIPAFFTLTHPDDQQFFRVSLYARAPSTGGIVYIQVIARDINGTILGWGAAGDTVCVMTTGGSVITGSTMARYYYAAGGPVVSREWIIGPRDVSGYQYAYGGNSGKWHPDTATLEFRIGCATSGVSVDVDAIFVEECTPFGEDPNNSGVSGPTTYFDSTVMNLDRVNAWFARFGHLSANIVETGRLQSEDHKTYFDLNENKIVLDSSTGTATDITTLDRYGITRNYYGTSQRGTTKIFGRRYANLGGWSNGTMTISTSLGEVTTGLTVSALIPTIVGCGATLIGKLYRLSDGVTYTAIRPIGYNGGVDYVGNGGVEAYAIDTEKKIYVNAWFFWSNDRSAPLLVHSSDFYDGSTASEIPYFGNGTYGSGANEMNCTTELALWVEFAFQT